ncbi:2-phosphosulfolactate phosphatase [Dactylosporangium sp. NPDC051484]|uniref:2-phosphosulfolactate phosphatase n=1 Tax=Dactylosporangium sp. NPDC051484 TaxID=3154942 RepID=UPI00344B4D5A
MDAKVPSGTVVIAIDVIRAFTTAAIAFERGATEIVCAPSVEVGRDLRRRYPDRLLVGETGGSLLLRRRSVRIRHGRRDPPGSRRARTGAVLKGGCRHPPVRMRTGG